MPIDRNSYLNFDLLIENYANGYRTRVINSPSGEEKCDFTLPFNENELRTFLALPNYIYRHLKVISSTETDAGPLDPKMFGERLFKTVFGEGVGIVLARSFDEAKRANRSLRIRLRLNDVPELALLPWEYLYNPQRDQFLILSGQVALIRYMELPEPSPSIKVELPLRVLVMVSKPQDVPPLEVEQEWKQLQQGLDSLVSQGKVVIERMPMATSKALQQRLRQGEYHIFHFIGHGWFDEATGASGLIIEDESGKGLEISAKQLGVMFEGYRPLQLIFLNACEGARALSSTAFSGTAQHLVRQNLPAVIAMQFPISDQGAICLSYEFYQALAEGYPVDRALTEARKAIYTSTHSLEWATPVLFMRSEDGRLFQLDKLQPPVQQAERYTVPATYIQQVVMPTDYTRTLVDIVEAIKRRRLLLFVGADLPAPATGLPDRQSLANALAQQGGLTYGLRLATVAQQIMNSGNRWDFTNFLLQRLEPAGVQPGAFYRELARLLKVAQPELIITTAYHRLLEFALQKHGDIPFFSVAQDAALSFTDANRLTILKLYGDIQQLDSLIVTEQDQNALLRGRVKLHMVDEVRRALRHNSVLFLGYDLQDPAVNAFFDEVAGDRFQMRSYAVWSGLTQREIESLQSNRGLLVFTTDTVAFVQTLVENLIIQEERKS